MQSQKLLMIFDAFTCLMYSYSIQISIDAVRGNMLRKMVGEEEQLTTKSKIDLSQLPPCRDNLIPHIRRVNHRLAIYKRADIQIFWFPKPYDPKQGWERNDEGVFGASVVLRPSTSPYLDRISSEDYRRDGTV